MTEPQDIGGGLAVLPVTYVPQPSWKCEDGLPRCTTGCGAACPEPKPAQYQAISGYTTAAETFICAVMKTRVTEHTYCQPALVALRQKANGEK